MSRAKPRYGNTGVRLSDTAQAMQANLPHARPQAQHFVAVDLKCKECGDQLWRFLRETHDASDGSLKFIQVNGYAPAIRRGVILVECLRCDREVPVPEPLLAQLLSTAAQAVGVGGHARHILPV